MSPAEAPPRKPPTQAVRRVVVKLGTNTLCHSDGRLRTDVLASLAKDVAAARAIGVEVVLVSSGAIGLGRQALGLAEPPRDIKVRQACAAIGQHRLVGAWQDALGQHNLLVAQVLVTHHTFQSRRSYLNLRTCLEELLSRGIVPVINENDTVSIEEIDASFGDNDHLAALVAGKLESDLLVVFSDVSGLLDRDPSHPDAARVAVVEEITEDIMALARGRAGAGARGGMASKLANARLATSFGIPVHLADGRREGILTKVLAGDDVGTRFLATQGPATGRQRWLATARAQGTVHLDEGAVAAMAKGAHLLPAGITGVTGTFDVESVVDLVGPDRQPFARAVSVFSSDELTSIQGLPSEEAASRLGLHGAMNVTRKGRVLLTKASA